MRFPILVVLAACGSSGTASTTPDAAGSGSGSGNTQHVVECRGTAVSGQPSACPHGDCDETSASEVVKCTAYASWIVGSKQDLCASGQTASYGVLFAKSTSDFSSFFYQVVECNSGTPTLHACTSGFTTDPNGYNGQPGFVCTH